ncbi:MULTISPECIES: YegP family protein [Flavobacterium]|uniref:YegP family protein n=1 Tax=Flavobacterium jumunjinense TaxID=998845 RepID=A0ABV5GTI5_9FLAO|nr:MULTISPECIES: YegP family protein [Flavobacterium]
MATFVITKRLNGLYKYELTSRKGKTIFTSNSFELRFECEEEIVRLKANLENLVYMRFRSGNGKFFFRIIFEDRQVAISRKYSTQLMLQKGINEIEKYGSMAEILDFSTSDDIFADVFGEEEKAN